MTRDQPDVREFSLSQPAKGKGPGYVLYVNATPSMSQIQSRQTDLQRGDNTQAVIGIFSPVLVIFVDSLDSQKRTRHVSLSSAGDNSIVV
jgi:hypothetical protein